MANTRINQLPADVMNMIASYSCGHPFTFFAPATDYSEFIRKFTVVRPFLNGVLCGQEALVEQLYFEHGSPLLFEVCRSVNYSGQIFDNQTALQLAWGARDYRMCKLLIEFFERDNQSAAALAQIEAKFPENINSEQLPYNFDLLSAAFLNNIGVREAVEKFKKDFAPGIVLSGYHFNVFNLDTACQIYDTQLANIPKELRDIFGREIIGYLQRLVPAHLASVLSYGLYLVVEEKCDPAPGVFCISNVHDIVYYPLDRDPNQRLGYEVALHSLGNAKLLKSHPMPARTPSHDPELPLLIKYHQQNESKFVQLKHRLRNPAPRCNVM